MNPVITILEDIAAGLDVERQSVDLHLAFGHIGDGHGHFSESEKWSAGTARSLLPFARAAIANIGDSMDADTIAALHVLVEGSAHDDERVPYLLAELGCAFWDEGGRIAIDPDSERHWEAVLDHLEGK
jgi:hypothetical protein